MSLRSRFGIGILTVFAALTLFPGLANATTYLGAPSSDCSAKYTPDGQNGTSIAVSCKEGSSPIFRIVVICSTGPTSSQEFGNWALVGLGKSKVDCTGSQIFHGNVIRYEVDWLN